MEEFLDKFKSDLKTIWENVKTTYMKLVGRKPKAEANGTVLNDREAQSYEINLVPVVKAQMIRAQRIRNIVLFVCIVVASASAGMVLILLGIKSGQDIAMASQDGKIERMSQTLNSYAELNDLVAIQSQLAHYEQVTDKKAVLSRVFGALGAMLPQGKDDVQLSELRVNLKTSEITMSGQADAKVDPLIDYRVLESFKKGVGLTKYDYGRYVDIDGKQLPTQCVKEADDEGNAFRTGDSYYAWWDVTVDGCQGAVRSLSEASAAAEYHYSATADVEWGVKDHEILTNTDCDENGENCVETEYVIKKETICDENGENCQVNEIQVDVQELIEAAKNNNKTEEGDLVAIPKRVKIWRTPQFDAWYAAGQMEMDGTITGIEHFDSVCYVYRGTQIDRAVRWTSTNDCVLAPDGLTVTESTNGRDESDNLVLKFSAAVTFVEDFFAFANKHMIAIGPMGQNVTDSFIQIGNMFTQEAESCEPDDVECLNNGRAN